MITIIKNIIAITFSVTGELFSSLSLPCEFMMIGEKQIFKDGKEDMSLTKLGLLIKLCLPAKALLQPTLGEGAFVKEGKHSILIFSYRIQ